MPKIQRQIAAIWRMSSGRLISRLARRVQDLGLAEDLAQEALLRALETWPRSGIPEQPEAWLMTTAKNKAIDHLRREARLQQKLPHCVAPEALLSWQPEAEAERWIADDLLSLIFTACHPVLGLDARVCLALRVLGGLSTAEIAQAYLLTEPTVAQRLVRAKRSLKAAQVPFEAPDASELEARLPAVLEVIYLIFNAGYTAADAQGLRPALCQEALRLGFLLAGLLPAISEVQGLLALMALQASRLPARSDAQGQPVLLLAQNRRRWDPWLIQQGLKALLRAELTAAGLSPDATAAACPRAVPLGFYALQAEIAACHARAHTAAQTDWLQITALYDALVELNPSPVIALNRAVAVGMAYGPEAGLEALRPLCELPELAHYSLLPSVQGDLSFKTRRWAEAAAAFERAAELTQNPYIQAQLLARAAEARQCRNHAGDSETETAQ